MDLMPRESGWAREERVAAVFRRRRAVMAYLVRRVGSFTAAQDLFGELLVLAFQQPVPDDPEAFRHWLFGRARGLSGAWNRSKRRQREATGGVLSWHGMGGAEDQPETFDEVIAAPEPAADQRLGAAELATRVLAALDCLPEPDQQLLLNVAQGVGLSQLAHELGWSRMRVRRRLAHARQRLLVLLGPDLAGEVRLLLQGHRELLGAD